MLSDLDVHCDQSVLSARQELGDREVVVLCVFGLLDWNGTVVQYVLVGSNEYGGQSVLADLNVLAGHGVAGVCSGYNLCDLK